MNKMEISWFFEIMPEPAKKVDFCSVIFPHRIQSQYLSDFVGQILKKLVKGVIKKYFFRKFHRLSSNVYRISEKQA